MLQVPILRAGRPYYSKETLVLDDYASKEPIAEVSQANPGLVSRDLAADAWSDLQRSSMAEYLAKFRQAARHFMEDALPVGDAGQTPEQFVAAQSATTGLPHVLCRRNMQKIEAAMLHMAEILDGLTGGVALATLDAGYG
ncbi:MAG: aldehyde dehydrogenase, partial [Pirellulales bacterium]|nr:aldehyde dehydrogenase [Pirellulales bacterium]